MHSRPPSSGHIQVMRSTAQERHSVIPQPKLLDTCTEPRCATQQRIDLQLLESAPHVWIHSRSEHRGPVSRGIQTCHSRRTPRTTTVVPFPNHKTSLPSPQSDRRRNRRLSLRLDYELVAPRNPIQGTSFIGRLGITCKISSRNPAWTL